jgi:3D (Asp-Asp-Asp) domain-containing protein
MPYIKKEDRERIDECINPIQLGYSAKTAGDLNYIFSLISRGYIEGKGKSYQTMNDIIGALEGAKLELYRRIVAPYEDEKIVTNDDIF